jgi:hypothetical protein
MSHSTRNGDLPGTSAMSIYGIWAIRHWARWLPLHYAAIPDPAAFFGYLGEQVSLEVDALADEIAGDDPPGEGYLGKVQRLTMARYTAEKLILPDLVYPEPRRYRHAEDDISLRVRVLLQQAADEISDDEEEELW